MFKKNTKEIMENGKVFIVETYINNKGEVKGVVKYPESPQATPEPTISEPTQLDRIEYAILKSQEQIAQEARDAYTLELIEGGVIA